MSSGSKSCSGKWAIAFVAAVFLFVLIRQKDGGRFELRTTEHSAYVLDKRTGDLQYFHENVRFELTDDISLMTVAAKTFDPYKYLHANKDKWNLLKLDTEKLCQIRDELLLVFLWEHERREATWNNYTEEQQIRAVSEWNRLMASMVPEFSQLDPAAKDHTLKGRRESYLKRVSPSPIPN